MIGNDPQIEMYYYSSKNCMNRKSGEKTDHIKMYNQQIIRPYKLCYYIYNYNGSSIFLPFFFGIKPH